MHKIQFRPNHWLRLVAETRPIRCSLSEKGPQEIESWLRDNYGATVQDCPELSDSQHWGVEITIRDSKLAMEFVLRYA